MKKRKLISDSEERYALPCFWKSKATGVYFPASVNSLNKKSPFSFWAKMTAHMCLLKRPRHH